MSTTPRQSAFALALHALFERLDVDGSPERRAWDVVAEWHDNLQDPAIRQFLETAATDGFDHETIRAMWSLTPRDVVVLADGHRYQRQAVLLALEQRLAAEAEADD